MSTLDDVITGNFALKDQRKALKWINTNIHLFGGDPEKVTIAGESAGGHAVSFQLLGENSEGTQIFCEINQVVFSRRYNFQIFLLVLSR